MKRYTHPDLLGVYGENSYTLGGVQYPRVWWQTVTNDEIVALGFVQYVQPEPEPQPETFPILKPYQFWAVMRTTGHEAALRAWVNGLNDESSPTYDPLAWAHASAIIDFSLEYRRDHPLVEAAREVIGVEPAELDDLWRYAARL